VELTNRGRRALLIALDYDSYCISLLQGQGLRILSEDNFPTISKRDSESFDEFERKLRELAEEIINYVKIHEPVTIVIGSPGDLSKRLSDILRLDNISIYRDTVSIGGCEGVQELVRRDVVRRVLERYSEIRGEEILEEYMATLARDPDKVLSGLDNLYKLAELVPSAVDKLVVIDSFMRADKETRDKISKIILTTLSSRGEIVIVSEESSLGNKLRRLGGVLAVLRYSVDPGILGSK